MTTSAALRSFRAQRRRRRHTSSRILPSTALEVIGDKLRPGDALFGHRAGPRDARKQFIEGCGARVAPWRPVASLAEVTRGACGDRRCRWCSRPAATAMTARARRGSGRHATRRVGAWRAIGEEPAIAEAGVDFVAEFSVILARWEDGRHAFWDSPQNEHREGILRRSTVPCSDAVAPSMSRKRARRRCGSPKRSATSACSRSNSSPVRAARSSTRSRRACTTAATGRSRARSPRSSSSTSAPSAICLRARPSSSAAAR